MRYQVVEDLTGGHCFRAAVVDTSRPRMYNGLRYSYPREPLYYEIVCKCFDAGGARMLCEALNKFPVDK